jgi:hypothetical protein
VVGYFVRAGTRRLCCAARANGPVCSVSSTPPAMTGNHQACLIALAVHVVSLRRWHTAFLAFANLTERALITGVL